MDMKVKKGSTKEEKIQRLKQSLDKHRKNSFNSENNKTEIVNPPNKSCFYYSNIEKDGLIEEFNINVSYCAENEKEKEALNNKEEKLSKSNVEEPKKFENSLISQLITDGFLHNCKKSKSKSPQTRVKKIINLGKSPVSSFKTESNNKEGIKDFSQTIEISKKKSKSTEVNYFLSTEEPEKAKFSNFLSPSTNKSSQNSKKNLEETLEFAESELPLTIFRKQSKFYIPNNEEERKEIIERLKKEGSPLDPEVQEKLNLLSEVYKVDDEAQLYEISEVESEIGEIQKEVISLSSNNELNSNFSNNYSFNYNLKKVESKNKNGKEKH